MANWYKLVIPNLTDIKVQKTFENLLMYECSKNHYHWESDISSDDENIVMTGNDIFEFEIKDIINHICLFLDIEKPNLIITGNI